MTDPEKYARPGLYLDTTDHGRLIEENCEAYERDQRQRLLWRAERIENLLEREIDQLARDEVTRLENELAEIKAKLEEGRP